MLSQFVINLTTYRSTSNYKWSSKSAIINQPITNKLHCSLDQQPHFLPPYHPNITPLFPQCYIEL